ncbi:MAG TPA: YggS family pyridoxal phosphate-dependent enzyme [Burkholderiales bacterium]|nr:YggS family pyridoxal phosphate-dependent enzyme [Burkholderiales bacterium]
MRSIHDNLQAVKDRIARAAAAAGRRPESVTLLAVSKTHPPERIEEAYAAGQRAFGENYVQEAAEKIEALRDKPIEWHLIGPLQSNKTRVAAGRFAWVHTVDSEKLARRLSGQRSGNLPPLNVLVQVNVSGEASKSGVAPEAVLTLVENIKSLPRLRVRGLMAVPEPGADRARYHELKELYENLKPRFQVDTLSVGMSDDLELAIAEGATMVRVGTAIFGARNQVRDAA